MRQNIIQSSFLSGVLSPEAAARVDTDAYNQGLLEGINIVPRPLGGVRRRPGLRFVDTLPNVLTRVTGQTITAANGGTTANANDGSTSTLLTTTTDVGTTNPFVVVHYDLGAAADILFADVLALKSTGGSSTEFCIQYSTDNAAWTTLGDAFELVDTTARSYRRGSLTATSARYWRVVKVGGTDMGAVDTSLQEFNLWTDSGTVSAVRLFPFEVSTDTRYLVALTDRSMTVYQDDAVVAVLPSPYASADLAEVDGAQDQDSLVLVHEDHQPRFVFPELSTMYSDPITFTSLPQYDFDDTSSPTPTSCVQTITFAGSWAQGDTFQIELEGARTGTIVYAGDAVAAGQSATAANIAREVQKLYTVQGFTGVTCARTGALTYAITFAGASAKAYELLSVVPLTTSGTVTVVLTTPGVARTEDVWSATRGWPRTVTFFERRMYFGGSRSLPQSHFGSRVNQITDFEITEALDDDAIFTTLAGQQLNAVQGIFSGRNLQIFTSGGEFRYAKQQGTPITPADAPVNQTQYGAAKIRPVSIDGATIYVQRTKKAIRDFRYDYEEDAYNSLGISALAPHLINDVVDLASWNGSSTDEINLVFVVNGDGTVAVYNSRREANVSAWCQWITAGFFKAAAGLLEEVYFAVRRIVNGVDTLFLEVTDPDHYTDCSVASDLVSTKTITDVVIAHSSGSSYTRTLETSTAHGLALYDVVTVSGMTASGDYLVEGAKTVYEIVDSTHFRIKSLVLPSGPAGAYVSGGTFASGSTTTMTGLDHLDGEEVRVKADGYVLDDATPASGSITLSQSAARVEAGLNFNPTVTPMPLNMMMPDGANFMRKRRAVKVRAKVYETLGLVVNGRPITDTSFDVQSFDEPATPYTGIRSLEESTNWDEAVDKTVTFTQVDPLPMTILGIDVAMEGNS